MNLIFPIFLTLLCLNCSSKKQLASNQNSIESSKIMQKCPDEGVCTVKVLKHKSIDLKTDDIGQHYIRYNDSKNSVIIFEYKEFVDENIKDANYTERIEIEVPAGTKKVELKNKELNTVNVVITKQCFCRGQAGTFKIENGNLILEETKSGDYKIQFSFNVDPIITKVNTIEKIVNLNIQ